MRALSWIGVLDRLIAAEPRIVVPGHGTTGGREVLDGVRDYLRESRDETWRRRDSPGVVAEVREVLVGRYSEWTGREWIERGVGCLCVEWSARTIASVLTKDSPPRGGHG
ncbi:hypothetical protein C8D88_103400 [Lentzea atacamensis]|uniref:Metallo-beta-lactamase superfamily protein n=1 Tax=Lentzea atacamensis TaxID=531938 RepID=A0A316I642_9PSEU|nr:hypothetical protein [Lentzea atacamensis]PWK88204.1 hypothetical protein C8D88_103400 [Lentzea atacamensis]